MSSGDDWLMGTPRDPVISWKDRPVGHTVKGTIAKESDYTQRRDDDGDLEWWDDEKTQPKMQLIVHLKTGEIKPDHDDHAGIWRLFVASKGLKDAIRDAVKRAGVKALAVDGVLSVTYKGEGPKAPNAKKTHSAPKLFHADYTPPADKSAQALDLTATGDTLKGSRIDDEPPF